MWLPDLCPEVCPRVGVDADLRVAAIRCYFGIAAVNQCDGSGRGGAVCCVPDQQRGGCNVLLFEAGNGCLGLG